MEFIEFESFFRNYNIHAIAIDHLCFTVTGEMIIKGETRLSYLTILKITEAFRDYYWASISNGTCDSICKQIDSHYFSPFHISEIIDCYLKVIHVSSKSLYVSFEYYCGTNIKAIVNMLIISYSPESDTSIALPKDIVERITISKV